MTVEKLNDDQKNELLMELMNDLKNQDKAYSLEGPMMLTILKHDDTYRNRECFGTEFLPESARIGSRGEEIFVFAPEDPQEEYKLIEVKGSKMDQTFALMLDDIQQWMIARYARNVDDPGRVDNYRKTMIGHPKTVSASISMAYELEAHDNKALNEAADVDLTALPHFGMF